MKISKPRPKPRRLTTLELRHVAVRLTPGKEALLNEVVRRTGMPPSVLLGRAVQYGRDREILDAVAALANAHLDRLKEILGAKTPEAPEPAAADSNP